MPPYLPCISSAQVSALAPLAGPLDSATPLLLRGSNFAPLGDELLCDLAGVQVAATFGDAATLRCDFNPTPSPNLNPSPKRTLIRR